MAEKIPFDDEVMTLIMGLGGYDEPGQHGRKQVPAPEQDTVEFITSIRDMCEEFLRKIDKGDSEEKERPEKEDENVEATDMKIDED